MKEQKRLGHTVTRELKEAKSRRKKKRVEQERIQLVRHLEEAVRARDEFLSIASHELKTPLTPLQLRVQGLLRAFHKDASAVSTQHLVSNLRAIEDQVARFAQLIENLLDISRLTSAKLELKYESLDLMELAQETVNSLQPQITQAGCKVVLKREGPIHGEWDRLRLEQVLTNLLSNAIKYGPGKPIDIRLTADETWVSLSVIDHGIGIAPEDQARIFGRFERAVPAQNYGGFGLGLWISRHIIDAHRGKIQVKSQLGAGSSFTIELPRHKEK